MICTAYYIAGMLAGAVLLAPLLLRRMRSRLEARERYDRRCIAALRAANRQLLLDVAAQHREIAALKRKPKSGPRVWITPSRN